METATLRRRRQARVGRVRRGAAGLALAATVGAIALTPAGLGSVLDAAGAASMAPAGDCAAPFPVSDLAAGQPVTGLTVSRGTTPEGFTGEVLGVLKDAIAPGVDMVMMRLTSPEVDRVGIWQGMSGSPVYAADGRLIGAVAYGLAAGPSPVAGVTPFEQMDDYLAATSATGLATGSGSAPAARVPLGARTAQKIAAATDVSAREAGAGFTQLHEPLQVSGLSRNALSKAATSANRRGLGALGTLRAAATGTAGNTAADASSVVAGGNLGVAASYGDITIGGVGTVTSVCNGRVVGFGHPMTFDGKTSLFLNPAEAVYVQEDPTLSGFKAANLGAPLGTISDDRSTGVTGTLGPIPASMKVTDTLTYGTRSRTGSTRVAAADYNAEATFLQVAANQDRVLDDWTFAGSELQTWTIAGHTGSGSRWSAKVTDRYASDTDLTYEQAPWDVATQVEELANRRDVTVDSVTINATASADPSEYSIIKVAQARSGRWVPITRTSPITARPGQTITLRAILATDPARTGRPRVTENVTLTVPVPANARRGSGRLELTGGNDTGDWELEESEATTGPAPVSLSALLNRYRGAVRNDQMQADTTIPTRRGPSNRHAVTIPSNKVINGHKSLRIRIIQGRKTH